MKALKKVPSDAKGLGKLPTAVRNKMGYMEKGGKVFKPHKMYKDGKAVMAKSMADHLRLKKQGYTHKK